jgi:hypothetical protein
MRAPELTRLLLQRVRRDDGIALVLALVVMSVMTIVVTTATAYTTQNQGSAQRSKADDVAFALAEAGLNNAAAMLGNPSVNALSPTALPSPSSPQSIQYEGGTAEWWGTLDQSTGTWSVNARGTTRNPTGAAPVVRTVSELVDVQPSLSQPANTISWNYIWATRSGYGCDMTIQQSVAVASPLYVEGNLCLQNTATIGNGPLVVKGRLVMYQKQNGVGTPSNKVNEVHLGDGCQYWNKAVDVPCAGPSDNVYARILDDRPPAITPPAANWDGWYLNSNPGPFFPCVTASGPVPVFDGNQNVSAPSVATRDGSVVAPFNLTPGASYSCRTAGGELTWDAPAHKLTIHGTVFIDGSAYVQNGAVNEYDGQGSLYVWGTFLIKNSYLCAVVDAGGTGCAPNAAWNPNQELILVAAHGDGALNGLVPSGDSIQLVSATLQGALYATNAIDSDTTSQPLGPMIGSTINLGQSVSTSFPMITIVPTGMISGTTVYAQAQTPRNFSG